MRTNSFYIVFISLIAAFGGLLFGFDIAVFSGTIPFIQPYYQLSEAQLGWTGSSLYVGCIIGTLVTGYATDRFGRKPMLIVAAAIFMISSVLMGWASSYYMLIFWRIVAGIGVGAASMLSPLYIAEISPASIRGRMVSINQLTIVIGILLAYFTNYVLADMEDNWRWMFTSGAIPSALFLFCVFFVPESPRWLVSKGYTDKAKDVLRKISGSIEVKEDLKAIESGVHREVKGKLSDLFHHGVTFIVLLGITMAVFQQISGANAIFFYAPIIFEKAGMDVKDQLFQQILIGAINLVFTLVAMQLVDRLGRKKADAGGLFTYGTVVISGRHMLLFQPVRRILVNVFCAGLHCHVCYNTCSCYLGTDLGNISHKNKRMAVAVSTCMLWVACFSLAYGFPVLIEWLNAPQTFFFFSGVCLLYFFILLRYVPETKGKTLEQFETEIVRH
jgi:SP family arabinose:H+ symporter-like MFS transporter